MIDCECIDLTAEQCAALADTQEMMWQHGVLTEVVLRVEADIERDSLGAIKKRGYAAEKRFAFRGEFMRQPNWKKLERIGIREGCDASITYALMDWLDAGILQTERLGASFKAVDVIRSSVIVDGTEWKIKDKGLSGRLGDIPLFISFGLQEN
jgi:hypothetical protein